MYVFTRMCVCRAAGCLYVWHPRMCADCKVLRPKVTPRWYRSGRFSTLSGRYIHHSCCWYDHTATLYVKLSIYVQELVPGLYQIGRASQCRSCPIDPFQSQNNQRPRSMDLIAAHENVILEFYHSCAFRTVGVFRPAKVRLSRWVLSRQPA